MKTTNHRVRLLALGMASAVLLAACGGDDGGAAVTAASPTSTNNPGSSSMPSASEPTAKTPAVAPVAGGNAGVATGNSPSTTTSAGQKSVTLSWYPPTHNTDGTPLTNLGGYRIYWGTDEGEYPNFVTIDNAGLASYVIDKLGPARWHFVVTALTTNGVESGYSNVFTKTIQ